MNAKREVVMAVASFHSVVRGGVIPLDEAAPLCEGTEVVVTPIAPARGTVAALMAALQSTPPAPSEWVDELEAAIAEGRRKPAAPESFTTQES